MLTVFSTSTELCISSISLKVKQSTVRSDSFCSSMACSSSCIQIYIRFFFCCSVHVQFSCQNFMSWSYWDSNLFCNFPWTQMMLLSDWKLPVNRSESGNIAYNLQHRLRNLASKVEKYFMSKWKNGSMTMIWRILYNT